MRNIFMVACWGCINILREYWVTILQIFMLVNMLALGIALDFGFAEDKVIPEWFLLSFIFVGFVWATILHNSNKWHEVPVVIVEAIVPVVLAYTAAVFLLLIVPVLISEVSASFAEDVTAALGNPIVAMLVGTTVAMLSWVIAGRWEKHLSAHIVAWVALVSAVVYLSFLKGLGLILVFMIVHGIILMIFFTLMTIGVICATFLYIARKVVKLLSNG